VDFSLLPLHTQIFVCVIGALTLLFHLRYSEQSVNNGPTILTTLGIFATFFGVAIGLSQFKATDVQQSLPALLDGLKTAFWGSIVGVGGALTLKFRQLVQVTPGTVGSGAGGEVTGADLARLLTSIQQALVGNEDSTLITQIKLARQENNDRLDALRRAQMEALEKLSEMGSRHLIEALKDVIRDFNNRLTEQFGENFKHLNSAVEKLVVWQDEYKLQVEATTTHLASITDSMRSATAQYQELVIQSGVFTKISSDLGGLLTALNTQRDQLKTSLEALAKLIGSASAAIPEIEKKLGEYTRQMTEAVALNQREINKSLSESATQMRASLEASGKDIAKLNGDVSRETAALIEKTKDQITLLDKALSEELKQSLEGLGKQLSALSEKFVSDYLPLTERLREVVQLARRVQ
jgi:hypothetical protein